MYTNRKILAPDRLVPNLKLPPHTNIENILAAGRAKQTTSSEHLKEETNTKLHKQTRINRKHTQSNNKKDTATTQTSDNKNEHYTHHRMKHTYLHAKISEKHRTKPTTS